MVPCLRFLIYLLRVAGTALLLLMALVGFLQFLESVADKSPRGIAGCAPR